MMAEADPAFKISNYVFLGLAALGVMGNGLALWVWVG
jgi:hypothetical protein